MEAVLFKQVKECSVNLITVQTKGGQNINTKIHCCIKVTQDFFLQTENEMKNEIPQILYYLMQRTNLHAACSIHSL